MKNNRFNGKICVAFSAIDNEATDLQYAMAQQLPSMNQRIADAYTNTRLCQFITKELPNAKINFVSEELAKVHTFCFFIDLPTKEILQKKESHKRELNLKLINLMITKIPNESKFCVSYGQLKDVDYSSNLYTRNN
jgi:hypothetical protein